MFEESTSGETMLQTEYGVHETVARVLKTVGIEELNFLEGKQNKEN